MDITNEKRRFSRTPVEIDIKLKEVESAFDGVNYDGVSIHATTVNLSPMGIAFKTTNELKADATYSAHIYYKDFNPCIINLRVLNINKDENGEYTYGCKFEGFNGNLLKNPLINELYNSINNNQSEK